MENVLVVGGAGFIGSHLCDALLSSGCHVVALDNLMRGKISNLATSMNSPKFQFLKHDANDTSFLSQLLVNEKIDFVFHLAANSDIQASALNPSIEFQCTASTTWSVLVAMREAHVKSLFFASTSAIYGDCLGLPVTENHPLEPISYYGAAKMASEAFIDAFSFMNDFDALIFRFPNVIGPRLTHGALFDFINRLQKDPSKLVVLGNGTQTKPYIYVSDLVGAILHLAENNHGINRYNVGVEGESSVKFLAQTVVKEMKLNSEISFGSDPFGWKGDVPKFSYDMSKILKTGWKPLFTSDQAVVKTVRVALGLEK
jgi:UDP-glucose 4-epimerase